MTTKTLIATGLAVFLSLSAGAGLAASPSSKPESAPTVRELTIEYRAHDGRMTQAVVLLPSWYGKHETRALPLVISPHGRGLYGRTNAELWGNLPTRGGFAVVNPDGQGEHLSGRFSWGAPDEIQDLARMPQIVQRALPWVKLDLHRIYAVGGSMGGQETLLLLAPASAPARGRSRGRLRRRLRTPVSRLRHRQPAPRPPRSGRHAQLQSGGVRRRGTRSCTSGRSRAAVSRSRSGGAGPIRSSSILGSTPAC